MPAGDPKRLLPVASSQSHDQENRRAVQPRRRFVFGRKAAPAFALGIIAGLVVSFLVLGAIGLFPSSVLAQVNLATNLGTTFGLGTADLYSTVIKIVQYVLGLLGLIALIIIGYGGFIWLTAGGNEERVRKAKRIITQAVIGLAIILLAWAIVLFVMQAINNATQGGSACSPDGITFDCQRCSGGFWTPDGSLPGCSIPGTDTFRVTWKWPADAQTDVPLCSIIQAKFNGSINPATVPGNVHARVTGGSANGVACTEDKNCASASCNAGTCQGSELAGTWQVPVATPQILKFKPATNFLEGTNFEVEITTGVREAGASPRPTKYELWHFDTGSTTLSTPPTVTSISPVDGSANLCLMTPIQSIFSSAMDVSTINDTSVLLTKAGLGVTLGGIDYPDPYSFSTRPASTLDAGTEYNVTLKSGASGIMDVCGNELDGDEDTTSEGTPTDDFIGASNPTFPAEPWNFFTDTDTTNVECKPEITNITPLGKYDDIVTIDGSNFGITGNTYFNAEVIDRNNCFNAQRYPTLNCVSSWTTNQIRMKVPAGPVKFDDTLPSAGAKDGGVRVQIGPNPLDKSNTKDFNVTSPQISQALGLNSQPQGGIGQFVTVRARSDPNGQFGTVQGAVFFRNKTTGQSLAAEFPCAGASWSNGQVIVRVPDLTTIGVALNSLVAIQLERSNGERSNLVDFQFVNAPAGPGLCQITPNMCGAGGDARSLIGENFGTTQDSVYFTLPPNPARTAAITGWTPTQVNIRVPDLANANDYQVAVKNSVGVSNPLFFDVPCGGVPSVVEDSYCAAICLGGANNGNACSQQSDCPGGSCDFATYASPNPFKDSTNACLNIEIQSRFTTRINDTTIIDANVFMQQCDDDSCSTISNPTHVAGVLSVFTVNPTQEGFRFVPTSNLQASTSYQVTITSNVKSETGVRLNADYRWHFKTKNDTADCPLDRVVVMPANATLVAIGVTQAYQGNPIGPNCTILSNDYDWNWSSDVPAVATVTEDAVDDSKATATAVSQGTTYINGEAEGKKARGFLKVDPDACAFNPSRCADPDGNGSNKCPNSVCNITLDKCEPVINSIDPISGPKGATVTVKGCYFEPAQGPNGTVIFGGIPGQFSCVNPWSDRQIVVTAPNTIVAGQAYAVTVRTNSMLFSDSTSFSGTSDCIPGVSVPASGMPGLCPGGLQPSASRPLALVNVTEGINLLNGGNTTNTFARFSTNSDDSYNNVIARGGSWGLSQISKVQVPVGTQAGPFRVYVNNCPSNSLDFNISCSDNGQCATGCCKNNQCVASGLCSSGGVGALCQISDNPNCNVGPSNPPPDMSCISNTGDTLAKIPPPPESPGFTFGNDCRFCCERGQQSGQGLTCVTDVGVCSGGTPGVRGLYCGDKANVSEQLCADPPTTVGTFFTGNNFCCEQRPSLTSISSNACLNTPITVRLNEPIDGSSVGADSAILYPAGSGVTINGNIGTPVSGTWTANGTAIQTTSNGRVNYRYSPVGAGASDYTLVVRTSQAGANDVAKYGVYHHLKVWVDSDGPGPGAETQVGDIWNLGTDASSQQLGIVKVTLTGGVSNTIGLEWDNDWFVDAQRDSNVRIYDLKINSGAPVDSNYATLPDGFVINPKSSLAPNTPYNVLVRGGARGSAGNQYTREQGIRNKDGVYLWDASTSAIDTSRIDRVYSFTSGTNLCSLDKIVVNVVNAAQGQYQPPDFYNCATDSCVGDTIPLTAGNQHDWTASAVDNFNNAVTAQYTWVDDNTNLDPSDVFKIEGPGTFPSISVTANPNNGRGVIQVTADAGSLGTKTVNHDINVSLCENPWPNPYPPASQAFPYNDATTNFSTHYCRDGNPVLPEVTLPLLAKNGAYSANGRDELIREFFFLRADSSDAIGIRVLENEDNLSAEQWYYKQFGSAAPAPASLTVDGYPAVRSGRTVYVSASNIFGGSIYNNIYLISYNEDASGETLGIYNQLLQNWRFNTNPGITPGDQLAIRRDAKRVQDLYDLYLALLVHKSKNGAFPTLGGGTYIAGLSTSRWPSWQETLGKTLGRSMASDPLNAFSSCPADFDQKACWREGDKNFQCSAGSHLYLYEARNNGDDANLYANLEYGGAQWRVGSYGSYNPCTSPSSCGCFNYTVGVVGSAADRSGPIISSVTFSGSSGTITVTASVTDAPSGVARVEFYLDGIRQSTDTDGSNGWTWQWNSRQFADGSHEVKILAYDTVGNQSVRIQSKNINNTNPDNSPPSVFITFPSDNEVVSGNVVKFEAYATDRNKVIILELQIDGVQFINCTNVNGVTNCSGNWNTTTFTNGVHELKAIAYDDYANIGQKIIHVTVSNPDVVPPSISIASPTNGANLTGNTTVTANAADNEAVVKVDFLLDGVIKNTDLNGADGWSWLFNTALVANGNHVLTARAYDTVNQTTSNPVNVTTQNAINDTTPPSNVQFIPPPRDGDTVSGTQTIGVTATDNNAVVSVKFLLGFQVEYEDNNAAGGWSWAWQTTSYANGWKTLRARAYDAAGNFTEISESLRVENIKDLIVPQAFIDAPADGATVYGSVAINTHATDDLGLSRMDITIVDINSINAAIVASFSCPPTPPFGPGTRFANCNVTWDTSGIPDGSYRITLSATDGGGNVGSDYVDVSVVNNLAVTFVTPTNGATLVGSVQLEVSVANTTNPTTVTFRDFITPIGSDAQTPPTTFKMTWNTLTTGNGNHSLVATARDNAGRTGGTLINVTVNNPVDSPPNITSFSINGGAQYTNSQNVTLNISATDDNGLVDMRFSNDGTTWSAWIAYAATASWTLPAGDGTKTVYAQVRDNASPQHISATATDTITLDTVAPAVDFTAVWYNAIALNGGIVGGGTNATWPSTSDSDVTIQATASDSGSGVSVVEFRQDGSLVWTISFGAPPYEYFWPTDFYGDGTYINQVRAYDRAGNFANSPNVQLTLRHCAFHYSPPYSSSTGCNLSTEYCCRTEGTNVCKANSVTCFIPPPT